MMPTSEQTIALAEFLQRPATQPAQEYIRSVGVHAGSNAPRL
ncbi:hypothetical protein PN477_14390 [Spirulina subsalsa CS-330]|nr:hypothetical protein [Spirulina subsalsa CS-330]